MSYSKQPKSILVVLPNPMGDAILCTDALYRLRRSLGHCRITFLGNKTANDILDGSGFFDVQLNYRRNAKGGIALVETARTLGRGQFDAAVLLTNTFRSAALVFLAGIKQRIGYKRDGRGLLLTHSVRPFRLYRSYMPISMLDYYNFLIEQAIIFLNGNSEVESEKHLRLFVDEKAQQAVEALFERRHLSENDRLVIMVPGGAFGPSKRWAPERFARLAQRLTQQLHCRVIICCTRSESEQKIARQIVSAAGCDIYNLADENLSLAQLKELIRRCKLMIANDTGPCHIAAAFDVPLVTLFGPTDPRWTATGYDKEIRLRVDVECGPCQKSICSRDHRCLDDISVDDVFAAAVQLLNEGPSAPIISNVIRAKPTQPTLPIRESFSPFAEQFVPLPDGRGLIHSSYKTFLHRHRLDNLADVFTFNQGQSLSKPGLGTRERLRIELPRENGDKVVLYLKRYGYPGLGQLVKRMITRRSRLAAAVYDFDAALALAQNSIAVARPIAVGQKSNWLGEKRSFVIIEELPQADALERLLPDKAERQKDYWLLGDNKELLKRIAALVGRFHQKGFYHRDLYLAHIFLGNNNRGEEILSLIDLQRVFKPLIFRRRWWVKDLAQLYYSGRDYFSRTDIIRFLREYLQTRRLTPEQKQMARMIYRKAQRIARHDCKRKMRQRLRLF